MTDKIEPVKKIPGDTKVNPDHISKREPDRRNVFREKIQREIEERLKNQNKR
jgi:hypothetical protein